MRLTGGGRATPYPPSKHGVPLSPIEARLQLVEEVLPPSPIEAHL